ncbi:MAG: hypothetical protein CXR30_01065 [Geobacter sp.]|nr:MAG: hypothetical protein CXR30_01065 [Geobacter sp.]
MSSPRLGNRRILACSLLLTMLSGCFGGTAKNVRSEAQTRADSLLVRAIRAEQKGDTREALKMLSEAFSVSASIEDTHAKAIALINIARLHRLNHEAGPATTAIDTALELPVNDGGIFSEAAQEKALILLTTNNADAALPWAEKSAASANDALLGRRLNLLGRILLGRNEMAASVPILEKALKENREHGNAEEEANSLRMLGIVARRKVNNAESERLLAQALDIDKRIGISSKISTDLEELSTTARAADNLTDAASFLERAYEVHIYAKRYQDAGKAKSALAEISGLQGDDFKAEAARKTARELFEKAKNQQLGTASETIKPSSSP